MFYEATFKRYWIVGSCVSDLATNHKSFPKLVWKLTFKKIHFQCVQDSTEIESWRDIVADSFLCQDSQLVASTSSDLLHDCCQFATALFLKKKKLICNWAISELWSCRKLFLRGREHNGSYNLFIGVNMLFIFKWNVF